MSGGKILNNQDLALLNEIQASLSELQVIVDSRLDQIEQELKTLYQSQLKLKEELKEQIALEEKITNVQKKKEKEPKASSRRLAILAELEKTSAHNYLQVIMTATQNIRAQLNNNIIREDELKVYRYNYESLQEMIKVGYIMITAIHNIINTANTSNIHNVSNAVINKDTKKAQEFLETKENFKFRGAQTEAFKRWNLLENFLLQADIQLLNIPLASNRRPPMVYKTWST